MLLLSGTRRRAGSEEDQEGHDGDEDGVHDPGAEVAEGDALAVCFRTGNIRIPCAASPATAVNHSSAPIASSMAARGNRGKRIRRSQNGLDEDVPPDADNHPRQVHHADDSCGRSVVLRAESVVQVACIWFFMVCLLMLCGRRVRSSMSCERSGRPRLSMVMTIFPRARPSFR